MCRVAHEYRRRVLDPLVIRPVQGVLSHPALTPVVARVEPQLHRVINIASTLFSRARTEWKYRVSSQWDKRVKPQWRRHAVPRIRYLDRTSRPYRARATKEYNHRIAPSLNTGERHLRYLGRSARVSARALASRTSDGYKAVQPYVTTVLRHLELYLRRVLFVLQTQRKRFVDPHVAKIWDKVKELSSGSPKLTYTTPAVLVPDPRTLSATATTPSEIKLPTPSYPAVSIAQTPPTDVPPSAPSSDPSPEVKPVVEKTISPTDETTPELTPASHETAAASSDEPAVLETLQSVVSVVSESLHNIPSAPPAIASLTEEIQSSVASAAATLSSKKEIGLDDPSLDEFFADLGLNEFPLNPGAAAAAAASPDPDIAQSREDEAEMLRLKTEETARKRTDIASRHSKWESELEAMIENKLADLRRTLSMTRKTAAAEIKESKIMKGHVESLDREGEKFLKGAENYFQQLVKEEKGDDDKSRSWSMVINRIEEKFAEKTIQVETAVNEWSRELIQREHDEVCPYRWCQSSPSVTSRNV